MSIVINFENVSKRYRLGLGHSGLRDVLQIKNLRQEARIQKSGDILWALNGVSFAVEQGEALGIIGANGAGKTTTLKLLSKVTRPTEGKITTHGRLSSLIELGAGFHPDLTGRENIFLNGTIMGLRRREIAERFDQIVAFAELERFIDTPVKRYSSGMYARLGFSVAAHVNPEILLVDEVLSVGDESFQVKCRDFIHDFVNSGRTSIFISHNLYAIDQLCKRVIWLDKGNIAGEGPAARVLRMYMDDTDRKLTRAAQEISQQDDRIQISGFEVVDQNGEHREAFYPGEDVLVRFTYRQTGKMGRPYFVIWIAEAQSHRPLFAANMLLDGFEAQPGQDESSLSCRFEHPPLMPRAYQVWVEVYGDDRSKLLYTWRVLGGFRIEENATGIIDEIGSIRFKRAHGVIDVPYEWGE